jgi:hypothetical protein
VIQLRSSIRRPRTGALARRVRRRAATPFVTASRTHFSTCPAESSQPAPPDAIVSHLPSSSPALPAHQRSCTYAGYSWNLARHGPSDLPRLVDQILATVPRLGSVPFCATRDRSEVVLHPNTNTAPAGRRPLPAWSTALPQFSERNFSPPQDDRSAGIAALRDMVLLTLNEQARARRRRRREFRIRGRAAVGGDADRCVATDDLRHSESVLDPRVSLRHATGERNSARRLRVARSARVQQARAATALVAEQASAPAASSLPSWRNLSSASRPTDDQPTPRHAAAIGRRRRRDHGSPIARGHQRNGDGRRTWCAFKAVAVRARPC